MIPSSQLTVVLQGDIRPETDRAIKSVRQHVPSARLVLSTYRDQPSHRLKDLSGKVDHLVLSADPGPLPPFTMSGTAPPSNLNRQLVTTQAGLAEVRSAYVLKMRSDIELTGAGFLKLGCAAEDSDRMLVSSFYTRHPMGLSCYLFHVSDWFVVGCTSKVKDFFSAPCMSPSDARWFESHAHVARATYAARRFRARYTPEQHITVHYAQQHGYRTPQFLNDWDEHLMNEYRRFLVSECLVAMPRDLGFRLDKYRQLERSVYQRLDCVSFSDWQSMVASLSASNPVHVHESNHREPLLRLRPFANRWRQPIIKACVMARSLGFPSPAIPRKTHSQLHITDTEESDA